MNYWQYTIVSNTAGRILFGEGFFETESDAEEMGMAVAAGYTGCHIETGQHWEDL